MTDPETVDRSSSSGSRLVPSREHITGGFSRHADLVSYIGSGLLIGFLLDWLLGTSPVMLIAWTLVGVAVGYYRLWQGSADLEEEGKRRGHGV